MDEYNNTNTKTKIETNTKKRKRKYNKSPSKKHNITKNDLKCSEESDDSDDSDYEPNYDSDSLESSDTYFEPDLSDVKRTLYKFILTKLSPNQRIGLKNKIKYGVDEAFELYNDVLKEKMIGMYGEKPTNNMWKLGLGPNEIDKYSNQLRKIRKIIEKRKISMKKILDSNLKADDKSYLIELFDTLQTLDNHSPEYKLIEKQINLILENISESSSSNDTLENELQLINKSNISLKERILNADIDINHKAYIYQKYINYEKMGDDSSVAVSSGLEWIETALSVPYSLKETSQENSVSLVKLKKAFEVEMSCVNQEVIEQLLIAFNNRFINPNYNSKIIAFEGSPGVGKCLGKDTPILMFDGSVRKVQNVLSGDLIMGDDSKPRKVISTCFGFEKMYLVKQSYGIDYRINESHILSLKLIIDPIIIDILENKYLVKWYDYDGIKQEYFDNSIPYENIPKKGVIIDIPVTEYITKPLEWRNAFKGYKHLPDYSYKEIDIMPFEYGYHLYPHDIILDKYKYNTLEIRCKMIDGFLSKWGGINGEFIYINNVKALSDSIITMLYSCGYEILKGSIDKIIITKSKAWVDIDVIQEEEDVYFGFEIDGNKRFLLGDYTVTHNTAIGAVISKAWDIPFKQISFGGIKDQSLLTGSNNVWVGSSIGYIAKALREMKISNGILFFDEIDKIADIQVQHTLLHCLDPIQNNKFVDNYLGPELPIDLSKCLILCAMNTRETLDPALLNRLEIIKLNDYTQSQKVKIGMTHLLPRALSGVNLSNDDLKMTEEACKYIINTIEKEGGVRILSRVIKNIVDKLAVLLKTSKEDIKELDLSFNIEIGELPFIIDIDIVKKLCKKEDKIDEKIYSMYT